MKILRIQAGLRQYQVAAEAGISATKLCEIELGRREPSPDLLKRLIEIIVANENGTGGQPTP